MTEIRCDAVAAADVRGFAFYKDQQRNTVTARCERCHLGFVIRSENTERMKELMRDHLARSHGNQ